MNQCNHEKIVKLMDKKLDLDDSLDVLDHIHTCGICREAVYQISRKNDAAYFIYPQDSYSLGRLGFGS
jgi:hypothetical protein